MAERTAVSLDFQGEARTDDTPAELRRLGIKALMLAVLEDAIQSLRSPQRLVRVQAEHWFVSREHGYVFSLAVICETLELDPSAVRRSVLNLVSKERGLAGPRRRRSRPNSRQNRVIQLARSGSATVATTSPAAVW